MSVSDYLFQPAWFCSDQYHRIFSRYIPEEQFSKPLEYIYRIALFIFTSLVVPLALLGILGSLIIRNLCCYTKRQMTYMKGSLKEKADLKVLKIFHANICMMPGPLPKLFGGVTNASSRINKLVEVIKKEKPDFLSFNEASDPLVMKKLAKALRPYFAHIWYNVAPGSRGKNMMPSGLFIAANCPVSIEVQRLKAAIGQQKYVRKSVVYCTAKMASKDVTIACTHLQPHNTAEAANVRTAQLKQIIKKRCDMLVGDLNLNRGSDEHSELLRNFEDPLAKSSVETATDFLTRWRRGGKKDRTESESIDYICKRQGSTVNLDNVRVVQLYDTDKPAQAISDHHVLIGETS